MGLLMAMLRTLSSSGEPEKIVSRYAAVLQNSVEKADLYLLQGNRDESAVALKSHMTTFLPNR